MHSSSPRCICPKALDSILVDSESSAMTKGRPGDLQRSHSLLFRINVIVVLPGPVDIGIKPCVHSYAFCGEAGHGRGSSRAFV